MYNDIFKWTTRGTKAEGFDPFLAGSEFDVSTLYGATERWFYEARIKWPTAKIGFVVGHHLGTNQGNYRGMQDTYFDSLVDCCKKWSMPYVDIRLSGLSAHTTELQNLYFENGDGTHYNELACKKFYVPQITEFLKKL
jgi:hypothetical protein